MSCDFYAAVRISSHKGTYVRRAGISGELSSLITQEPHPNQKAEPSAAATPGATRSAGAFPFKCRLFGSSVEWLGLPELPASGWVHSTRSDGQASCHWQVGLILTYYSSGLHLSSRRVTEISRNQTELIVFFLSQTTDQLGEGDSPWISKPKEWSPKA